ncbi:hypothetical protein LX77_01478 [Gelidibacter algens]|jgi:hypothetical protein|uniref:Uncharacterized protein n=1 Tax=Gelidibacter algens TaxID=49280 RepID=A0A327SHE5_9FLAO|nr:hypothetical protein LX77_01478 [Gelidibacter algens]
MGTQDKNHKKETPKKSDEQNAPKKAPAAAGKTANAPKKK